MRQRSPEKRASRRPALLIAAAVVVLAAVVLGRGAAGRWARFQAARDLETSAISDALRWLERADWIDPRDSETELLRAQCLRQLELAPERERALARAAEYGASPERIECERVIGQIRTGELYDGAESRLDELRNAGLSPTDIAWSYILGCVARQDLERAHALVTAWSADNPGQPHNNYMRGFLLLRSNQRPAAAREFRAALEQQPGHELAEIALAELLDQEKKSEESLRLYVKLANGNPQNVNVLTGLARVLRKTGRPELARATLQPFLAAAEHSSTFAVEMACIELDAGDYERAATWLEQASPTDLAEHTTLSAAGIALAMLGDTPRAARAFQWIADEMSAVTLLHDMELDPTHEELAREFQQLMSTLSARRGQPGLFDAAFAQGDAGDNVSPGMRLYNTHCEACHGPEGRGDGRAARHLHPTPRDLRLEKVRLVSGDGGIPTRDDVANVIRLGVPGTAMQPLPELRDTQVEQLVDVVIDMRRSGLREAFLAELAAEGEPVDEREIAALVDAQTVTRQPADVPDHLAADPESVARGAQRYVEQSCHSCHGEDGTGAPTQMLFDDLGLPCATRDLALDPFKGGNTAQAVYLRILLGMPGSPHPATVNLAPDAMSDLVHFCQSLGKEPKQQLTNHARALRAALQ